MKKILILICLLLGANGFTQVGVGTDTPNEESMLEVFSEEKGVILPRLLLESIYDPYPMSSHVQGMIVFNISETEELYMGYYYNDGEKWIRFIASNDKIDTVTDVVLYGLSEDLNEDIGGIGDFFLDLNEYKLYGPKDENGWNSNSKDLVGPAGNQTLMGNGPPNETDVGRNAHNGDMYIDVQSNIMYGPIEDGVWLNEIALGAGQKGDRGNSILNGSKNPNIEDPEDSIVGDLYIDLIRNQLWGPKALTVPIWPGPIAITRGDPGVKGEPGKSILSGAGIPKDEGNIGDYYINTLTVELFGPKEVGGWFFPTISLRGGKGTSILSGDGLPADTQQGQEALGGDYYIDIYGKRLYGPKNTDGTWPIDSINFNSGIRGLKGEVGQRGNIIASGDGSPYESQKAVDLLIGDFYINKGSNIIYGPKTDEEGLEWSIYATISGGAQGVAGSIIHYGKDFPIENDDLLNKLRTGDYYISHDNTISEPTATLYGPYNATDETWEATIELKSGPIGPQGARGLEGKTLLNGVGPPSAGLTSNIGDFYIDTDDSMIYGPKEANGWSSMATSLIGATIREGDEAPSEGTTANTGDYYLDTVNKKFYGPRTDNGEWGEPMKMSTGVDGKTILSGDGPPEDGDAAGIGVPGDFYIDTYNKLMYGPKKGDNTWGLNNPIELTASGDSAWRNVFDNSGATNVNGSNIFYERGDVSIGSATNNRNLNITGNITLEDDKTVDGVDVSALKTTVDDNVVSIGTKLPLEGGNMTGNITLEDDITVDGVDVSVLKTTVEDNVVSIGAKLPLAGGNMTGDITLDETKTVDGVDVSVLKTKVDANTNAVVTASPVGSVIAFSIPDGQIYSELFDNSGNGIEQMVGWALCNGNNGTPDLRGRFIRAWNDDDSNTAVPNGGTLTPGETYNYNTALPTSDFKTNNTSINIKGSTDATYYTVPEYHTRESSVFQTTPPQFLKEDSYYIPYKYLIFRKLNSTDSSKISYHIELTGGGSGNSRDKVYYDQVEFRLKNDYGKHIHKVDARNTLTKNTLMDFDVDSGEISIIGGDNETVPANIILYYIMRINNTQ